MKDRIDQLTISANDLATLYQIAVDEGDLGEVVRVRYQMLDIAREADKVMAAAMERAAAVHIGRRAPRRSSRR